MTLPMKYNSFKKILKYLFAILWFCSITTLNAQIGEALDRGIIALKTEDNKVYLGWRLLAEDPKDIAFNVVKSVLPDGKWETINNEPITNSCNFIDPDFPANPCYYGVVPILSGKPAKKFDFIKFDPKTANTGYISIRLQGNYPFNKVGIADLDGDGKLDFVIKQPNQVTDPGVWRRSVDTWKIEAYKSDGTFLWRKDLGWNIEQGVWWSPMIVYDFDGDGKAEVALKTAPTDKDYRNENGRVLTGEEYCSILDGLTGNELDRVDWITRGNISDWGDTTGNRANRHLMGVAYLDGKRPALLVARGTYTRMRVDAYNFENKKLKLIWSWDGDKENPPLRGQGAHGMHCADIDNDGRDEVILGSAVLDDNGKLLWNTGLGHPDAFYVTDIDPNRKGLEIIYGIEPPLKSNAICLVEALTGKIIWGCQHPTTHAHSQGLLADIDPDNPGMEFYIGEKEKRDRWLYSAIDGKLLSTNVDLGSLAPNPIYWDDTSFKAYINRGNIVKYKGERLGRIQGAVIALGDIAGDWREEIITSLPGELRIYSTTILSKTRKICFMQDRLYRLDVAMSAMGYLYPPQLGGYLLKNRKPESNDF